MKCPSKEFIFLIFTACTVNLMVFAASIAFTWTSPSIPRLYGLKGPDENPLGKPITASQESLLTSLFILGSTLGPFLAGPVCAKLGRKLGIIIFTFPVMICFIMKAFATKIEIYYAARIIGGLTGGVMYTTIPLYIAEISEPNNRGAISAITGLFGVVGNLYTYAVGAYVKIMWFSLSGVIYPAIMIVVMTFFIPETPYYWVQKDNFDEARKVLKKYRNKTDEEIEEELGKIKFIIENTRKNRGRPRDLFQKGATRKSIFMVIGIIVIQQISGAFPIQINIQTIFEAADSHLEPEISAIIVGFVKAASYGLTLGAVDRMGRKFLLMQSGFGLFISLSILGTFFYLQDNGTDVSSVQWIPIVCLVVFVVVFNSGIGIIPLVLMGELFPQKLKSIAAIIVITISSIVSFLVTFVFPYLKVAIGLGPCFWIFSVAGILCILYTFFIIPETKGKSLIEIQKLLEREKGDSKSDVSTNEVV